MLRATAVRPQGAKTHATTDCVVLEHGDRQRRRLAMKGVRGTEFLLDLPELVTLRGGDALLLENGDLIEVVAAPEALTELRVAQARDLTRLAWHLGNRHLEMEIAGEKKLRIRRDRVIEEMLRGLGAKVVEIHAPFEPEGGAYAPAAQQDHGDRHDHDHDHHDHGPAHGHQAHDHDHRHE
ncbi:MAG TPA: urease accessory protein UreE [Beijerinckiaceae bacterium]|nr:urease accessory protein UreE [Beijerinckiaceae bacterium]